jgi:hypothetical protein
MALLAAVAMLGACADDRANDSLQPFTDGTPSAADAGFPASDAGSASGGRLALDAGPLTNIDAGMAMAARDAAVPDGGSANAGPGQDGGSTDGGATGDAGMASDAAASSRASSAPEATFSAADRAAGRPCERRWTPTCSTRVCSRSAKHSNPMPPLAPTSRRAHSTPG